MSAARHKIAQALFEAGCALPPGERTAFLERECARDEELRALVLSLLDLDAEGSRIDRTPFEPVRPEILAAVDPEPPLPARIGRYRVLSRLGAGGMGVVYEAEQDQPRRRVALKVLRADLVSPEMLRRFEIEAQVLGRLSHPGIARILEAGTTDLGRGPQPFFAMELIEGEPLIEHAQRRDLSVRARLELLARVCDAVQHAHQKGVIHRDLKPSNILVDGESQPRILDFGVARATDADLPGATLLTRAGELLGTLPYMSPEQVSGDSEAVDTRCDVYALGVLAYELLTGKRPFNVSRKSLAEAARIISEEEPTRLGRLRRDLAGDVETIVGKALEKDPRRRYGSAEELASDLRRHLADEPVTARPASAVYQLRKFASRNRALVGGVVVALVAMLAGTILSIVQARRAERSGRRADELKTVAEERADVAVQQTYRAGIASASLSLAAGDPHAARQWLDAVAPELRGFEWRYLDAQLDMSRAARSFEARVVVAGYASQGREIVTLDERGALCRWSADLAEARGRVDLALDEVAGAAIAPDGSAVCVRHGPRAATISAWATDSGRELRRIAVPDALAAAWPNWGWRLAVANGGRALACTLHDHKTVYVTSPDDTGWRACGLGFQRPLMLRFASDDRLFVTGSEGVTCVDIRTGVATRWIEYPGAPVHDVAGSPDDALEAFGLMDGRILVVDGTAGQRTTTTVFHPGGFGDFGLKFDPTRKLLASAGSDGVIRLWEVPGLGPRGVLFGRDELQAILGFTSDGRELLTLGNERRSLRRWDVERSDEDHVLRGHSSYVYPVGFSVDGRRIFSGAWDGTLRAWDAGSGARLGVLARHPEANATVVMSLAVAPGGRLVATGSRADDAARLWDVDTGHLVAQLAGRGQSGMFALAWSPDGRRLAGLALDLGLGAPAPLVVWDVASRESVLLGRLPLVEPLGHLAFTPDGVRLIVGADRALEIRDSTSGAVIAERPADEIARMRIGSMSLDPTGELVATSHGDGRLRLWSARDLEPKGTLDGAVGIVYSLAFTPDGRRLVSGGKDGSVRLWDLHSREQLLKLDGHTSYVYSVAVSPDGARLVSGSGDGTVRVWDTVSCSERVLARERLGERRAAMTPLVSGLLNELGDAGAVAQRLRADAALQDFDREAALQVLMRTAVGTD